MMPAAMMLATALPALLDVVERRHHDLRELGLRQELDRHLGHHAEQPFGAGHRARAGRSRRASSASAPISSDLALDGGHAQLQDVVHREPVLEAVHAAGILGDVAADGAGDLARGIGRVVEAVRRGGLGDREIAHAGLHARGARRGVDLEDAHEAREREQHAVAERQRAAGKPGAGAARDDRHAQLVTGPQDAAAPAPRSRAARPPSAPGGRRTARRTRRA